MEIEYEIIERNGKKYVKTDSCESYPMALSVAGYAVHRYQSFGSYQGEWVAEVEKDGDRFWIKSYYGSCSGCDHFEANCSTEYADDYSEDYGYPLDDVLRVASDTVDDRVEFSEIVEWIDESSEWDCEADEAREWLKQQGLI